MPFPVTPRVEYALSPLDSVTYQISFPSILKIDSGPPADLQEMLRDDYPIYSTREPGVAPPHPNFPKVRVEEPGGNNRSYFFESSDKLSLVRLTKSLMSLTFRDGSEDCNRIVAPMNALAQVYRPGRFVHTCVRHRYVIRRSRLGLASQAWTSLLQPWVFGPFSHSAIADDLEQGFCRYSFRLPNAMGSLEANFGFTEESPSNEQVLLIEAHTLTNKVTVPNHVANTLNGLSEQQRLFFQYALGERLHVALKPNVTS